MTMLIRGGILHTMTEQGTFTGDVLLQEGRIAAVGHAIELPDDVSPCTLSAAGLHVLPGLIDLCIGEVPEADECLLRTAREAGVTGGLIWPADEGPCRLLSSGELRDAPVHRIQPEGCTDSQLTARLQEMAACGVLPAVDVNGPALCRRVLGLVEASGVRVLLAHLTGCEGLEGQIKAAGCPVALGARRQGTSPWEMAVRLHALGVPLALTVGHPDAALKHLPLCASLCVREGLDREEALPLVTCAPADILGLTDAGRIRPGDRADLVLYDGDPLLLSTGHVITIQHGKICC